MASKLYRKFIVELQQWVAADTPKHDVFNIRYGVCTNYSIWLERRELRRTQRSWYTAELQRMLGMRGQYPFNKNRDSYRYEQDNGQIWKNVARRDWLRMQQFKSDMLVQFFRELNSWVDRGMPEHKVFMQHKATCSNYSAWLTHRKYGSGLIATMLELTYLFRKEGLDSKYPFNKGIAEFNAEAADGLMWHNQARLEFVQRHTQHMLLVQQ